MVKHFKATVYLDATSIDAVAQALDLVEVPLGAHVSIRPIMSDSQLYDARLIGGTQIVSPVQIALDLIQDPSRGEEAALAAIRREYEAVVELREDDDDDYYVCATKVAGRLMIALAIILKPHSDDILICILGV